VVSCQVILGTFFLSILGIKHTRHPVTASAPSVPEREAAAAPSPLTSTAPVNHREQPAAAPRL
jgi:hypothetical protein